MMCGHPEQFGHAYWCNGQYDSLLRRTFSLIFNRRIPALNRRENTRRHSNFALMLFVSASDIVAFCRNDVIPITVLEVRKMAKQSMRA